MSDMKDLPISKLWGYTRIEIPGEELDKIMQRMLLLCDPFDAMVDLLEDETFPNERVNIIHFIQLSQTANEEIKKGRKSAQEVFSEWDKLQHIAKEIGAKLNKSNDS